MRARRNPARPSGCLFFFRHPGPPRAMRGRTRVPFAQRIVPRTAVSMRCHVWPRGPRAVLARIDHDGAKSVLFEFAARGAGLWHRLARHAHLLMTGHDFADAHARHAARRLHVTGDFALAGSGRNGCVREGVGASCRCGVRTLIATPPPPSPSPHTHTEVSHNAAADPDELPVFTAQPQHAVPPPRPVRMRSGSGKTLRKSTSHSLGRSVLSKSLQTSSGEGPLYDENVPNSSSPLGASRPGTPPRSVSPTQFPMSPNRRSLQRSPPPRARAVASHPLTVEEASSTPSSGPGSLVVSRRNSMDLQHDSSLEALGGGFFSEEELARSHAEPRAFMSMSSGMFPRRLSPPPGSGWPRGPAPRPQSAPMPTLEEEEEEGGVGGMAAQFRAGALGSQKNLFAIREDPMIEDDDDEDGFDDDDLDPQDPMSSKRWSRSQSMQELGMPETLVPRDLKPAVSHGGVGSLVYASAVPPKMQAAVQARGRQVRSSSFSFFGQSDLPIGRLPVPALRPVESHPVSGDVISPRAEERSPEVDPDEADVKDWFRVSGSALV